jgi:hypothetical protein
MPDIKRLKKVYRIRQESASTPSENCGTETASVNTRSVTNKNCFNPTELNIHTVFPGASGLCRT